MTRLNPLASALTAGMFTSAPMARSALAVSIALGAFLAAGEVAMPPEFRPVRAFIEEGIAAGVAPSVAVAVVKDDRVIWAEGFGLADLERRTPATADTIYILASVSKPITATGLMVLADRGLIDLDRPANDYLPGAKLRAHAGAVEAMTLRRLANHTSGMPVHYNFYHAGARPLDWDETIRRYGFAAWEPGERWEYSNLAFGLLGYITEVVSRKPWGRFLEEEVFDPLGMSGTSDRVRPGLEARAAAPYAPDAAGRFVRIEPYAFDHPGASAIWSSASDLARFARMHLNGGILDGRRVLREETARAMQTLSSASRPGTGTGIGWAVGSVMGHRTFSHTGGMPGVSTEVRAYPDDGAATIVLTNTHDRRMSSETTRLLARALLGEPVPERARRGSPGGESASPERPGSPPPALEGSWEGRLVHFDGDIRMRLDVGSDGAAAIRFNDRPLAALRDLSMSGDSLTATVPALLRTQEGFHGVPDLEFRLRRRGDRLTGICVALAQGYFALSHWVDLRRIDGRPPRPSARF